MPKKGKKGGKKGKKGHSTFDMSSHKFKKAVEVVKKKYNVKYNFKREQMVCMEHIAAGRNVFAILPTGFGKSAIFGFTPAILDELHNEVNHICLIVSPLRALMRDQVNKWKTIGIPSLAILQGNEMETSQIEDLYGGKYKLIFASPETFAINRWIEMLKCLAPQISLVAFDEVHCIVDWGDSFRPLYKSLNSVRCYVGETPVLATSATVNQSVKEGILKCFSMEESDFINVTLIPDRENIELIVDHDAHIEIYKLGWYCDMLKEEGNGAPKCIIYVRSLQTMTHIFGYFEEELGTSLFGEGSGYPGTCLVEMYYSDVDVQTQELLPVAFKSEQSPCRCVIATIAFGMGIEICDIRYIVHWGPPKSLLNYWQEVGRGGRDGRECRAVMYTPPHSLHPNRVSKEMLECVKTSKLECVRHIVLSHMKVEGMREEEIQKCCGGSKCCSYCNTNI